MNKAVFLDKDGTIIEDVGYLSSPNDLKLIPGSAEAIGLLNKSGYKVIVVSNQAGIAKGYLTEDVLQSIDKRLQKELLKRGAFLDAILYCPHHPEHGVYPYKMVCECRKPGPGLIKDAEKFYNIDSSSSYMIGDKLTDIKAGENAKIQPILVLTGMGKESSEDENFRAFNPVFIAKDLLHAVKHIINGDRLPDKPLSAAGKVKVCCK